MTTSGRSSRQSRFSCSASWASPFPTCPWSSRPRWMSGQRRRDPSSQLFMLVGVLILVPVILAYTVFVYYTFRGKVRAGEGYH